MGNVAMEVEMKGGNMNGRKEIDSFNVLGIGKGWTANLAKIVDKCANKNYKENVILKGGVSGSFINMMKNCEFVESDKQTFPGMEK